MEWNIPPIRFDNIGIPSAFLSSARPALFAGVLLGDTRESEFREEYYTVGAQLDLAFKVAHRYSMTLSFGYAQGYRGSSRADSEVMVSLKVL